MDELDRAIVNALQGGFPICDAPYREVAEKLGLAKKPGNGAAGSGGPHLPPPTLTGPGVAAQEPAPG